MITNLIPILVIAAAAGTDIHLHPIVNSISFENGHHAWANRESQQNVLIDLTDRAMLRQAIDSDVPVLVDFYADWCQPCHEQGRILNHVAKSASADQARIVKINYDEHQSLVLEYKVDTLPTLLIFKGGQVVTRGVGVFTESQIRKMLGLRR